MHSFVKLALIASVVLLSACGGGGGSTVASVEISASNANQIIRETEQASTVVAGFALGLGAGIFGTSAVSAAVTGSGEDVLVVSPTAVENCSSGGSVNITEGANFFDFEFNNCVNGFLDGGFIFPGVNDGGIRYTILSGNSLTDFEARIEFRNYTVGDNVFVRLNGALDVDYIEDQLAYVVDLSIPGNLDIDLDVPDNLQIGLTPLVDASYTLTSYETRLTSDLFAFTQAFNGSVLSSAYTGLAVITTPEGQGFVTDFGDLFPKSGRFIIDGANGNRIRVTANDDRQTATVDLDLDGEPGFDAGQTYIIPWVELLYGQI